MPCFLFVILMNGFFGGEREKKEKREKRKEKEKRERKRGEEIEKKRKEKKGKKKKTFQGMVSWSFERTPVRTVIGNSSS